MATKVKSAGAKKATSTKPKAVRAEKPIATSMSIGMQVKRAYQSGSMNYEQIATKFSLRVVDVMAIIEGKVSADVLKNIEATAQKKQENPATKSAIKAYYQGHGGNYYEVAEHFGIQIEEVIHAIEG